MKPAYCGNDCSCCPRYTPAQGRDVCRLKEAAEIWLQVGWWDALADPEDMACSGSIFKKKANLDRIARG
ncbi:MAG: hypothetical protein KQI62_13405 [Deltaproteobacteria bacterium]|nr:hypothetical protein [Deltaproteobacteria bacterium]